MADRQPRRCRGCKRRETAVNRLSIRGLCQSCALDRMERGARMMAAKTGPVYDRWRENLLRALQN